MTAQRSREASPSHGKTRDAAGRYMRAMRRYERRLEALRGLVRQDRALVGDEAVTRAAVLVNEASNLRWRLEQEAEARRVEDIGLPMLAEAIRDRQPPRSINIDADDENADWLKPCKEER